METSILIAKMLSVAYLSIGLGLLASRDHYEKVMKKILDSSPYMILGGFMAVIAGILITEFHNIWVMDWTVIITIIGWIALVKGIFLLAFPKSLRMFEPMLKKGSYFLFATPFTLIIGLVLGYYGFIG